MRNRLVCATVDVIGWHQWVSAPERQKFLKERHRHTFRITGFVFVSHGDRAIECFDLADAMVSALHSTFAGEFGTMSCEHIAEWLCDNIPLSKCIVLEDGMQGAEVWAEQQRTI